MDVNQAIRREILRLAGSQHKTTCVSTKRLSAFYNIPEKQVRAEMVRLAEQNQIRISAWDGRQISALGEQSVPDAFVESGPGNGQVFVQIPE